MTLLLVGLLAYYLISNTITNLEKQSIATGIGFLHKEAAFEIGESPIAYSAADTYGRALVVGFLNTLIVSFVGIVITILLGTVVGVARLSSNWLVSKLAGWYIELFQDIPVLLQLFFWYAFFYNILPSPKQALNPVLGVFLSNRGLVFGIPESHPVYKYMALALVVACIGIYSYTSLGQGQTGADRSVIPCFSCLTGYSDRISAVDLGTGRRPHGHECSCL